MGQIIDIKTMITLLVPALLTVAGWFIANIIADKRERNNKKREKVVDYLIASYRVLASAPYRDEKIRPLHYAKLEEAIADVQLFGTTHQVAAAKEIVAIFAREKSVDLSPLILLLRDDLRGELNLKELDDKTILHLRIK